MISIPLLGGDPGGLRVLCLGAHCDDIEIGCGGTILQLALAGGIRTCHWVVLSSDPERAEEAALGAALFLEGAREREISVETFRDGFFPYVGQAIKEFFEELKRRVDPDLILTHFRDDLHQDHRVVSELTWNTFRDHLILEYEIPKYEGDLGRPSLFVHLENPVAQTKVRHIMTAFRSQREKRWFTPDAFLAMMRIRGLESHAPDGYAEAFHCRKALLGVKGE